MRVTLAMASPVAIGIGALVVVVALVLWMMTRNQRDQKHLEEELRVRSKPAMPEENNEGESN